MDDESFCLSLEKKIIFIIIYSKLQNMKSSYQFEDQITYLRDICQTNITLAQCVNGLLQNIPKSVLSKIVQQLKIEYQKTYKDDPQTLTSIRNTLNLTAREQVTDIDKLFIDLGDEIKDFYGKDHLMLKKHKDYLKICPNCKQPVANDNLGLKWHTQKCKLTFQKNIKGAPQQKKRNAKKRDKDTQQKYEERQDRQLFNRIIPNISIQASEIVPFKQSKKQQLQNKKKTKGKKSKCQALLQQYFKNSNQAIFHELEDQQEQQEPIVSEVLIKNQEQFKIRDKTKNSLGPVEDQMDNQLNQFFD